MLQAWGKCQPLLPRLPPAFWTRPEVACTAGVGLSEGESAAARCEARGLGRSRSGHLVLIYGLAPQLLPCPWPVTKAQQALGRALKLLRLAEALCCERCKLRSFWPLPDEGRSPGVTAATGKDWQGGAAGFCSPAWLIFQADLEVVAVPNCQIIRVCSICSRFLQVGPSIRESTIMQVRGT